MGYKTAVEKKLVGSHQFERKVRRALKLGTYRNERNETCSYKKLLSQSAKSITNNGVIFYQKHEVRTVRHDKKNAQFLIFRLGSSSRRCAG